MSVSTVPPLAAGAHLVTIAHIIAQDAYCFKFCLVHLFDCPHLMCLVFLLRIFGG